MSQYRSAMALARNHGAAGTGTSEFVSERFSALVLILLGLVIGWQLLCLSSGGITLIEARAWLGYPLNAGLMLALFSFGMLHAYIASKVLLEDYVHIAGLKLLLIAGLALLVTGTFTAAAIAILRTLFLAAA